MIWDLKMNFYTNEVCLSLKPSKPRIMFQVGQSSCRYFVSCIMILFSSVLSESFNLLRKSPSSLWSSTLFHSRAWPTGPGRFESPCLPSMEFVNKQSFIQRVHSIVRKLHLRFPTRSALCRSSLGHHCTIQENDLAVYKIVISFQAHFTISRIAFTTVYRLRWTASYPSLLLLLRGLPFESAPPQRWTGRKSCWRTLPARLHSRNHTAWVKEPFASKQRNKQNRQQLDKQISKQASKQTKE